MIVSIRIVLCSSELISVVQPLRFFSVYSFWNWMASFNSEQMANVRALLSAIRQDGTMDLFKAALLEDSRLHDGDQSEFELLTPAHDHLGGMSEAAKRRGASPTGHSSPPLKQRPVLPVESKGGDSKKLDFPPGIESLEDWGRCVLDVGKYGSEECTFVELATSSEKAKQSYCSWILSQRGRSDFSAQIKDFQNYLKMREQSTTPGQLCYPGSSVPRKMG